MTNVEFHATCWRKSTHSGGSGSECVEVAALADRRMVGIRDSKNPDGPVLSITPADWSHFLRNVRQGTH